MRKYACLPMTALVAFSTTSWSSDQFEEEIISRNTPQLSISGSLQHPTHHTGQAHALLPLLNSEETKSLAYGYLTGQYSPLDWSVGAGGGVRTALSDTLTIGGYSLVEHQRSERGNRFWRFSPGFEVQGNSWHLSANAYIPFGKNEYSIDFFSPAHMDFTELEFSNFEHHTGLLKTPFITTEKRELGIKGVDLVGRWQVSDPLTLSLGGYYLPSEGQSRAGIVAGIAYQVSAGFTLEVQGHQDQEEKQVQARLSLHLGKNQNTSSSGLSTRFLQRVGAEWAKPYTQTQAYEIEKVGTLENLYFFKHGENGTTCTAEAPCGKISQDLVHKMPQKAILLLAEGGGAFEVDYTDATGSEDEKRYLSLENSQSLLGRGADFKQPAPLNNRPVINRSIFIKKGPDFEVSRIKIQNTSPSETMCYPGLMIHSAHHGRIHHIQFNITEGLESLVLFKSSDVQVSHSESVITNRKFFNNSFGSFRVHNSQNIHISHNTVTHTQKEALISTISELIVINSSGIVFEDNIVSFDGEKAIKVIGMNIFGNVKEFSASRNKFTIKHDGEVIAMANIDGTHRKAEQNSFVLTTLDDNTVSTNEGDPSGIQLQPERGKPHIDDWGNSFERKPIASSSATSWLGSLFSR